MATASARAKILPLPVGLGLLLGAVVDLLEDPGHREHEGRLDLLQLGEQVLGVGAVRHGGPGLHHADLDEPGEGVRQRQEQQGRRVRPEQVRQHRYRVGDVGVHVAVGQHAALGPAGGTAGVDDRGDIRRAQRRAPPLDLGGLHRCAGGHDLVDPAQVDLPQVGQVGQSVADAGDQGGVRGALHHGGHRAGVGQDPGGLLGAGGLVDGHGDRAGRPDGVVDQGPLVAGPAHQRDPVTRPHAGGDQTAGDRHHLVAELPAGHVHPAARRVPAGELHRVRRGLGVLPDRVGEVGRIADGDDRWDGELAHLHSLVLTLAGSRPPPGRLLSKPTRPTGRTALQVGGAQRGRPPDG